MIKIITAGQNIIKFDLQRKRVKNINLRIKPDMSVHVSAGKNVPEAYIAEFVRSKADFILSALAKYKKAAENAPEPKKPESGTSLMFLGREIRLDISGGKNNSARLDGSGTLYLTVRDPNNDGLKKRIVLEWYKDQCREIIPEICRTVYPGFQALGVDFPEIRFRSMKSRWGSCQPKRKIITFSISLICAPLSCIEYVVCHEFTHFLHPDHSKKFYASLEQFVPDWKSRRAILNKTGCQIFF